MSRRLFASRPVPDLALAAERTRPSTIPGHCPRSPDLWAGGVFSEAGFGSSPRRLFKTPWIHRIDHEQIVNRS